MRSKRISKVLSIMLVIAMACSCCIVASAEGTVNVSVDDKRVLTDICYDQDGHPMVNACEIARALGGSAYVFTEDEMVQIVIGSKLIIMGKINNNPVVSIYNIYPDGNLDGGRDLSNPVQINIKIDGNDAYIPIESLSRALGIESFCWYNVDTELKGYYIVTPSCVNDFGYIADVSDVIDKTGMVRFTANLVKAENSYKLTDLSDETIAIDASVAQTSANYWINTLGFEPNTTAVVVTGNVQNGTIALNTSTTSVTEYGKIVGLMQASAPQTESTNNTVDYSNANEVTVMFNDKKIETGDVPAMEIGGRTFLPMRAILNTVLCALDKVSDTADRIGWIDAEQTAVATSTALGKTVWAKIGASYIEISEGETERTMITNSPGGDITTQVRGAYIGVGKADSINSIKLNDIKKTQIATDAPAFLYKDSYTMLPVRAVAETLDCGISWDESTQTVTITPPAGTPETTETTETTEATETTVEPEATEATTTPSAAPEE